MRLFRNATIAGLARIVTATSTAACGGSAPTDPPRKHTDSVRQNPRNRDTLSGAVTRATGTFRYFKGRFANLKLSVSGSGAKRRVTVRLTLFVRCEVPGCSRVVPIVGSISGWLFAQPSIPDGGMIFKLVGSGRIAPLGLVSAAGRVHGTGFIRSGRESLQLTLATGKGQATITAHSPPVPGFTAP